jgi:hypothetical protein
MREERYDPEDLNVTDGPHLTKADELGYYIYCSAVPFDGSQLFPQTYIWHQGGFWAKSARFNGALTGYFTSEDEATAGLFLASSGKRLDPFEARIARLQVPASRRIKFQFQGGHRIRQGGHP